MSDPVRPEVLSCDDVREMAGSFVLGALSRAESDAVRAHLATCPDTHAEIAELGSVLPVLDASVAPVEPPAELKARILAAAAADRPASAVPEPIPFPTAEQRTERVAAKSGPSTAGWFLRIAAVVAIVALTGWNLLLQGQLSSSQQFERDPRNDSSRRGAGLSFLQRVPSFGMTVWRVEQGSPPLPRSLWERGPGGGPGGEGRPRSGGCRSLPRKGLYRGPGHAPLEPRWNRACTRAASPGRRGKRPVRADGADGGARRLSGGGAKG